MLTYGEIIQRVSFNLGIPPTDGYCAVPGGILPRLVQDAYQQIWDAEQWPELIQDDFEYTVNNDPTASLYASTTPRGYSTPNTTGQGNIVTVFTLPKQYGPILRAWNASTGNPVKGVDRSTFSASAYQFGNANTQTEGLDSLTQLAPAPVANQPAATGLLSIVDSSNSEASASAAAVFLRGVNQNGERVAETVNTNGTTPVSSANQYQLVEAFSKTKIPSLGTITLKDSGSNILAVLATNETTSLYRRYQLNGIDGIPTVLVLTCKKLFVPFTNLFDYPICEMDLALIKKAEALAWQQKRQPTLAQIAASEAEKALGIIRSRELNEENAILMVPAQRG